MISNLARMAVLAAAPMMAIAADLSVQPKLSVPEQLIEQGHWKRARVIVDARFRENPREALANYLESQIRNAFGDRESPLGLAEKAVTLDGSCAKYHRQLAEVYGVKAQYSGMFQQLLLARRFRKEIDAAISLDGRDVQSLRDLMEFYLLAPGIAGGDKSKARAVAARIAGIDAAEGFSAEARIEGFAGDRAKVEGLLRKAVEAAPGNYRARIALGNFYLSKERNDTEAAEAQAKEAVRIDAARVDGYAILARAYAIRGRWSDLDAVLVAAEKEVPDDLTPDYRAGEALVESNRELDRATRYFGKYLGAEPEGNAPSLAEARAAAARVKAALAKK